LDPAPTLVSVDGWALALAVAAAVAVLRFRAGAIRTLAACCAAGVLLYLEGVLR
jgi:chromate transporter